MLRGRVMGNTVASNSRGDRERSFHWRLKIKSRIGVSSTSLFLHREAGHGTGSISTALAQTLYQQLSVPARLWASWASAHPAPHASCSFSPGLTVSLGSCKSGEAMSPKSVTLPASVQRYLLQGTTVWPTTSPAHSHVTDVPPADSSFSPPSLSGQ